MNAKGLRIAQVTYRYKPLVGGAEVYVDALRRALAPIACSQRIYQLASEDTDPDVVHVVAPRRTRWKLLDFNLALARHRADLNAHDLILVHNPEHLTSWLAPEKTILISHGATWTHERRLIRRLLRRMAMKSAFRRAGTVVANDSFVLRSMGIAVKPGTQFRQEAAPRIWFVPNSVDPDFFSPASGPEPEKPEPEAVGALRQASGPAILVPRNLTRSRGIDLAIEALALCRRLPPTSVLFIAGEAIADMPASQAYKAELESLVRSRGLSARVRFVGPVAREAMPALFRAAALTLVPTRYSEGTSLSALESMSCGTATLTTAVEGLLDLPGPHAAPDPASLAETMDSVWAERDTVGRSQREAVLRDFGFETWAEAWRGIVLSVPRNAGERQ